MANLQLRRALVDLAPDVRLHVDHVRLSDRGILSHFAWIGTRDGGAFEIPQISVSELDELGRIRRLDVYAVDQLDRAFARFDAIGASAACTADAWFEDRRRQALVSGDIDFWLADMQGVPLLAPNARFARSLIGTAGERLALERHLWSGSPPDGPVELETLFLTEVDEGGRIARGDDSHVRHRARRRPVRERLRRRRPDRR
jgi:hypothetical protein